MGNYSGIKKRLDSFKRLLFAFQHQLASKKESRVAFQDTSSFISIFIWGGKNQ